MTETEGFAPFYNDLLLSFAECRRLIELGANDRKSTAHAPVVGTIDQYGAPSQRVMILRHVNWTSRTLRFHTDARSTKIIEANAAPTSVLFYLPEAKIQVRLAGIGQVNTEGASADAAWESSTLFARRCYMAESSPGAEADQPTSGLPAWIEGRQPTAENIASARANFAALLVRFDSIEWLYLANRGHRRARWQWDDSQRDWQGRWLVP
jgi:pyridoxamine 5'-phosphate oxidase